MTWSYSGDPGASQTDEVRFWCQDTDTDTQLLSNEEIGYLLAKWLPGSDSVVFVAAVACEVIAAQYASEVDVSADGVSVSAAQLQDKYTRLAARLREQHKAAAATSAAPLGAEAMWDDTPDPRIRPLVFGVGGFDNYEAGRQDYGDYHPGADPNDGWSAAP